MPIPTDTFWNIKKLNWVFAISSLLLVAMTAWTIVQDYGGGRKQQQAARIWEAALTSDKIERELTTPEKQKALQQAEAELAKAEKDLDTKRQRIEQLKSQIQSMESQRATMEFQLNTDKAN